MAILGAQSKQKNCVSFKKMDNPTLLKMRVGDQAALLPQDLFL
jgi:hypothetical protein